MPLVSIVVPVYNVEKYLKRCIKSLISQTLNDIEIILVNDGSTDKSGKICDMFAERDSRIKVIHKSNGGLSSARNAGLRTALGKYTGFVDSDDDVEPDMYEKMYRIAEREASDCVMSDYLRVLNDGKRHLKTLDIPAGAYDRRQIKSTFFPSLIMGDNLTYGFLLSVWHCLYRTEFLKQNDLYFDEKIRWSEDNIFSARMGYCCNRFYYMKGEALYHYYENPGTITTSYRKDSWNIYCLMNTYLHDYFDMAGDYDFTVQLKSHMIFYACNCISQELRLPENEAKSSIRRILKHQKLKEAFEKYKMPDVNMKLKIQLLLMKYRQTDLLYLLKTRG